MLVVVSPAKALDFSPVDLPLVETEPRLLSHTAELAVAAKKRTRADFKKLMHLSDSLADLTYERFQAMNVTCAVQDAKAAAFAYAGDTYRGLDVTQFSKPDLEYAQSHFRMLSGLYGLLRPLDLIKAHRLEMGTKLQTTRGRDLYAFWGAEIAGLLNQDCESAGGEQALVNCASVEYFKSVDRKVLKPQVFDMVFKEEKDGFAKVISFFAKQARGPMARFIVKNRIDRSDGLKDFAEDGYVFRPNESTKTCLVFSRASV
ncbi:MAG: peroxide stress protein YaaA [Parvibaculum sp.]